MTKFDMVIGNTGGSKQVLPGGQPHPILRGGAPVAPNFWDLLHTCTQHGKQQPNFAWWSNYTRGKFLQGRPRML